MARSKFENENNLLQLEIKEDEVGVIEEAAFNIIRLKDITGITGKKVNEVMRRLENYCKDKEAKKHIISIATEIREASKETVGDDQNFEDDDQWGRRHKQTIAYHLNNAIRISESEKEKETPITLMESSYKKLTHNQMDLKAVKTSDYEKIGTLINKIRSRAVELESELYHIKKSQKRKISKLNRA